MDSYTAWRELNSGVQAGLDMQVRHDKHSGGASGSFPAELTGPAPGKSRPPAVTTRGASPQVKDTKDVAVQTLKKRKKSKEQERKPPASSQPQAKSDQQRNASQPDRPLSTPSGTDGARVVKQTRDHSRSKVQSCPTKKQKKTNRSK